MDANDHGKIVNGLRLEWYLRKNLRLKIGEWKFLVHSVLVFLKFGLLYNRKIVDAEN